LCGKEYIHYLYKKNFGKNSSFNDKYKLPLKEFLDVEPYVLNNKKLTNFLPIKQDSDIIWYDIFVKIRRK
jgi:hypothetical protein